VHTMLQNSLDFQSASPLPKSAKSCEQAKAGDEKRLDKQPRDPSPSTSSSVKPPYSYIALS
jgi:hypothetical protein